MKTKTLISAILLFSATMAFAQTSNLGPNVQGVIEGETLTISGTGNMNDYSYTLSSRFGNITEVIIEEGVTSIGDYVFCNCTSLTTVTIPNSVTSIGSSAFYYCSGLTTVTIGNSVTSIGDYAFLGCSGLTSIIIPNSVTSIGDYAFEGCFGLTSITIPNSVTSIGDYAFEACIGLTSVTIPNSVTSISNGAFSRCKSLTTITIPNSITSIGNSAFQYCSSLTSVTIPNSVTSIGDYALDGCEGLTSVIIGNSVASIGKEVFDFCVNLADINVESTNSAYTSENGILFNKDKTTIVRYPSGKTETSYTIPDGVTSIGEGAFLNCSSLALVIVPNFVTSIGSRAFYHIKNIVYSGDATGSPWGAFNVNGIIDGDFVYFDDSKTKLTAYIGADRDVSISQFVTSIGDNAFWGCSRLTSVSIPNSVTSIGEHAFNGCRSLTSITIPNSVTSIGSNAFYNCSSLTSITIPNSVTNLGSETFGYCRSLSSITIPNSITSIGMYMFEGCSGLTSITIPNSVTRIGSDAFWGCSSLTSVTIPNSVTKIGGRAFMDCSSLAAVAYDGTSEPLIEIEYETFYNVSNDIYVCVPENYEGETWAGLNVHKGLVHDSAIEPTCTESGKTEGLHCSECRKVYIAQEEAGTALGHTTGEAVAKNYIAPTCTAAGAVDSVVYCTTCKSELNRKTVEIAATGHNEVVDVAVAATCTAAGKTEGKHCSVCNEMLVAQTDIPALGHDFAKYTYNNDATTEADGTETAACEHGCGATDTRTAAGTKLATTPEKGTAVTETAASNVNIYAQGRTIVVENATEGISVYNAMGALVCRDAIHRVRTEINVRTAGIYIVRVGNVTKRVIVNN